MNRELTERAIKLSNRQLRRYNGQLRKNLKQVISCSTDNEHRAERIDEMEELVAAAPNLRSMFDATVTEGKRIFGLEWVYLTLDADLRQYYPDGYHDDPKSHYLHSERISFDEAGLIGRTFTDPSPRLRGGLRFGSPDFFREGVHERVRSEALVPIYVSHRPVGVVAFGSRDGTRFLEGQGGRYLRRLARTLGLKCEYFRALGSVDS